jgi:hypothetical protein
MAIQDRIGIDYNCVNFQSVAFEAEGDFRIEWPMFWNDVTGTLPAANGGTGITALGTGVATALGQNVTGSGSIVLGTSPTLTTPALGTPSAVVLTNATGTAASLTAGEATAALGLKTATTTVSVSGATAPTSGQVLTATSGTAATWQTPSAGSGDMVLLATATASNSSTVTFDSVFTADYDCYEIIIYDIAPATDNVQPRWTFRASGADLTDTYRWGSYTTNAAAAGSLALGNQNSTVGWSYNTNNLGNAVNEVITGAMRVWPRSSGWKRFTFLVNAESTATAGSWITGGGRMEGTTVADGIKLTFSTGNVASGTIRIYGYKN